MYRFIAAAVTLLLVSAPLHAAPHSPPTVIVVGGTPGGIMAAIGAARAGQQVVLLERTEHVGGLPANGLGATDIGTRGCTGGLFMEFVGRIRQHYVGKYGADSPQARDVSDGYHFEPSVAEVVFQDMLAEVAGRVTVLRGRQFDAEPQNVVVRDGSIVEIAVTDRASGATERYQGKIFIDATYEGDLAAAAGAPYRLGRESAGEFNEPMAGVLYKAWAGAVGPGSTGMADNAVQAYNYRLCLTDDPKIRRPIARPDNYRREEYASLVDDVLQGRFAGKVANELAIDGIGRVTNMVRLPNGKTDANNQHAAFLSTDLPEENWPWPTSGWAWRDAFARRLRDYTLGLLWFAQHDEALPAEFRAKALTWGLAADEYADNGHFPRQVYVREGRRIEGDHLWTAHDALPVARGARPPLHRSSVTASHYALDSHAVRKRESGRVHLDGFFSYPTAPYTVPYGVIVPKKVDNLLVPVAASATHIGFSTLRMEPCWMALGQAAGVAAGVAIENATSPRKASIDTIQTRLLDQGSILVYFRDLPPSHPRFKAFQYFALRGVFAANAWKAEPDRAVTAAEAAAWTKAAGLPTTAATPGKTTRGELLEAMYRQARADGR